MCCFIRRISAAIKFGYIYKPTLAFSLSDPALSLNCVILFNHPILETQFKIHANSVWPETEDWLNIILLSGFRPEAKKLATVSKTFFLNGQDFEM